MSNKIQSNPQTTIARPIAIVGSGPVGLLAALTLAPLHEKIILIGFPPNTEDRRTSALMMPAIHQLESLSPSNEGKAYPTLWSQLQSEAAPLARLRIIDATSRLVRAPTLTFHATEIGEKAFGYNIPNRTLNEILRKKVEATPNIIWHKQIVSHYQHEDTYVTIELDNGARHEVALIVGADGRQSPARTAAGITPHQWRYPQMALVLNFAHQLSHQNTSNEFHTADGPFTQVPLPKNRSSLVWVVKPEQAKRLAGLGRKALAAEIENHMGSMLGKVIPDEKSSDWRPQIWPLGGSILSQFGARRTILIGEAAHVFPPIGAQGLNLGFRDVADLHHVLRDEFQDYGATNVIKAYNRCRRLDIWARTGFVHTLNRILLADFLPAQLIRSTGLEALRQWPFLRNWLMREGLMPGSGLRHLLPFRS